MWLFIHSPRDHELSASSLQPGVCHYGTILACCYGWRRSSKGVCEGTFVKPQTTQCSGGWPGSCNVNECGFKPRPCQHRCVNTHGSYKCFCLSSHMLLLNATCSNSRTCAMTNCQYSCKDTEEGPRCLCPSPGLHLAPSGRACLSRVSGATSSLNSPFTPFLLCPYNRRCVNTFGSYYCKCHVGFKLKYISGQYDCVDINECAANTHTCSLHANCLNTQGSFKCKCKQGYKGSGLQCALIPENSVKELLRAPGTIKDRIKKLLAHKNSMRKKVKMKNITEPRGTPTTKVDSEPFSSEESISRDGNPHGEKKRNENRKKERLEDEKRDENHVEQEQSLRGDVFSPKGNEASEVDLVLVQRKTTSSHLKHKDLNISVDCTFDHGVCDWKQDIEDDFDWNPVDQDNAVGYYMAVSALTGQKKDISHLKLLLPNLQPHSNFCLLFHYWLAGNKVGKLRVFVKNRNNALAWEKTWSTDELWRMGKTQLYHGIDTPKSLIFWSEIGKVFNSTTNDNTCQMQAYHILWK
uniref:EGF like domain multiple 6 n=1 Tax=Bos mutus grunniens TaxID=30521 RepID=A0A8B9WXV2_BOSMU